MKEKVNRAVATGLLALMIANYCACNQEVRPRPDETTSQLGNNINNSQVGNNSTKFPSGDNSVTTEQGDVGTFPNRGQDLPGDVWKAMKTNGTAYVRHSGQLSKFYQYAIPLQFLQDEGVVYREGGSWGIHIDDNIEHHYAPLQSKVFIDENTKENDVYILLNYSNKKLLSQNENDKEVYVTTWKLKYTLDDDDYQALLKLKNDYRIRYFVQEMDNIYEPEVISKCTTTQEIVAMSAPYSGHYGPENIFPRVYIVNVDYDTNTITSALKTDDGYKFIDYNIEEAQVIQKLMNRYNLTRDDVMQYISVKSENTRVGRCLTEFYVDGNIANLSNQEFNNRYENSTRQHKLTDMGAGSMNNTFEAAQ